MAATQYGRTLIVSNLETPEARSLERISLQRVDSGRFSEAWLQKLVSRHPNLLPIDQIEPALTPAISICMELPVQSGFVDNLYVTPNGDLIVGETKLFRNPEARREVIGQILDYAKDLSVLSYEQLNNAIARASAPDGGGGHPSLGLYEAVAAYTGADRVSEATFIDAVSRNLARGRFLLLVIGDGVHSGIENMSGFLQQHVGMHFTLGLVELAVFKLPAEADGFLVQPRVLAKTLNIERAIVTIENGLVAVKPSSNPQGKAGPFAAKSSISSERFYEELATIFPRAVDALKTFTAEAEGIGVAMEFGKDSMILRWRDESKAWNLGTITTSGKVWTELVNGQADSVGRLPLSHEYLRRLAKLVSGAYVKETPKPTAWYVSKAGTYVTIDELLASRAGWLDAIKWFKEAMTLATQGQQ